MGERRVSLMKGSSFLTGYVTKPKNQYNCGSCASFAATALHETCISKVLKQHGSFTVEGVEYLIAKANLDLSEQYLLDCGYDGRYGVF